MKTSGKIFSSKSIGAAPTGPVVYYDMPFRRTGFKIDKSGLPLINLMDDFPYFLVPTWRYAVLLGISIKMNFVLGKMLARILILEFT